jgi:hypothetical protein
MCPTLTGFLRPTVIAGDTAPDDYQVIWNDLSAAF